MAGFGSLLRVLHPHQQQIFELRVAAHKSSLVGLGEDELRRNEAALRATHAQMLLNTSAEVASKDEAMTTDWKVVRMEVAHEAVLRVLSERASRGEAFLAQVCSLPRRRRQRVLLTHGTGAASAASAAGAAPDGSTTGAHPLCERKTRF